MVVATTGLYPEGPAFAAAGNLSVANASNNTVERFTPGAWTRSSPTAG